MEKNDVILSVSLNDTVQKEKFRCQKERGELPSNYYKTSTMSDDRLHSAYYFMHFLIAPSSGNRLLYLSNYLTRKVRYREVKYITKEHTASVYNS